MDQWEFLPHKGAKRGAVDHDGASDGVFLLLWGCRGRASTSSSTCGCLLRLERSFSLMISLLSFLSSLWTTSQANGSHSLSLCEWWRPHVLRVVSPSRSWNGGVEPTRKWVRSAGLGQPAQVHLGPVRSPLRPRGSSCHFALCPLQLRHFGDVILASKIEGLLAQSPVFYAWGPERPRTGGWSLLAVMSDWQRGVD
jgi:hypothetical protein